MTYGAGVSAWLESKPREREGLGLEAGGRTLRSLRSFTLSEYMFQSRALLKRRVMAAGMATSREVLSPPACARQTVSGLRDPPAATESHVS